MKTKNEAKHTPGPWEVSFNGGYMRTYIRTSGRNVIAHTMLPETDDEHAGLENLERREIAENNARLIAAAPELLEAAKEVKAVFEASGATGPFKAQYDVVCAAIAKAEGR